MISIYKIKPAFQKLLFPLMCRLFKMRITPNQLTIAAIILSVTMGIVFLQYPKHHFALLIIPIGFLLRMVLNALDGMMAREYDMQSRLGEILNELGDIISDLAIIFPFAILPGIEQWLIVLFGSLAIIGEFAGVLSKAMGKERRYDGPMGKSDGALFLSLFCLIYFFRKDAVIYGNWVFAIASGLTVISIINRLKSTP